MAAALVALPGVWLSSPTSEDTAPPSPSAVTFPQSAEASMSASSSSSDDEQLDVLAQRAQCSPSSFLSLLSALRPRLFSFSSVHAQGESDPATPLSLEQRRVQEHFSKLKLSFLHLEAKQKFLAWLAEDGELPEVSDEEAQVAEGSIQEGKAEIAEIKRAITEQHAQVEQLCRQLVNDWGEVDAQAALMRETWGGDEEWEELRSLTATLGETDPVLLCDQAHVDELLAAHRGRLAVLSSAVSASRAQVSAGAAEIALVEQRVSVFEHEERAVHAKLAQSEGLDGRVAWWESLLAAHGRLLGVGVRKREGSERSLLVAIRGWGSEGDTEAVELEVDCVPGSLSFNGARLLSGPLDPALFDQIVDYALEAQDLPWMVREVQATIMAQEERQQDHAEQRS